jgi:hypothetical protein
MTSRPIFIAIALLLTLVATTAVAQLAPPYDQLSGFTYPRNGLSSADEVFVLYGDNCGRPHPDPTRAPTVAREPSGWIVDIYLVDNRSLELCLASLAPDRLFRVSIGALPMGINTVTRRLHVRQPNESTHQLVYTSSTIAEVRSTPNIAMSGAWYNPAASGTGLFVNVLPPMPGMLEPLVLIFLADDDASGRSVWSTGLGQFVNATLRIEMREGGNSGALRTLNFIYQGCGKAKMSFQDAPNSFTPLAQLTLINGVASCSPPEYRDGF